MLLHMLAAFAVQLDEGLTSSSSSIKLFEIVSYPDL